MYNLLHTGIFSIIAHFFRIYGPHPVYRRRDHGLPSQQGGTPWSKLLTAVSIHSLVHSRIRGGKGIPPTIPEIQTEFGIKSPNGVNNHIKALIRKGYIRRDSSRARALDIVGKRRGTHTRPCGSGSAHPRRRKSRRVFQPADFQRSGDVFMLRVKGDSMKNARNFDGDLSLSAYSRRLSRVRSAWRSSATRRL